MVKKVAPLVGAWIETILKENLQPMIESHPSWVRGLKLRTLHKSLQIVVSHPSWVRGLKQVSSLV